MVSFKTELTSSYPFHHQLTTDLGASPFQKSTQDYALATQGGKLLTNYYSKFTIDFFILFILFFLKRKITSKLTKSVLQGCAT